MSIDIPNAVTSIGNDAFNHCIKLSSISLSENMAMINTNCFH